MNLFIDANIYLDFYRLKSVRSLLKSLKSVESQIFITRQIRDEVVRNRVKVALERITEDSKKLNVQVLGLPDLLFASAIEENEPALREELEKLKADGERLKSCMKI